MDDLKTGPKLFSRHACIFPRAGGAIYAVETDISIGGCANIVHNSGYDGGEKT